jgi:hypothetical protein
MLDEGNNASKEEIREAMKIWWDVEGDQEVEVQK